MIESRFEKIFGATPRITQFTPGRVNLIGSHTDYNGGMVFPTALPIGVTIALRLSSEPRFTIHSAQFGATAVYHPNDKARQHWADYAAGALVHASQNGLIEGGADVLIETNMPNGAGISSSAALIVCILKALRTINATNLSDTDIAVMARRVENEYIGMPCGIMDQMAVAIATSTQAMALDTKSLSYELVNIPKDLRVTVIHSGYSRKLSDGRYKVRKQECDESMRLLSASHLCLLTSAQEQLAQTLPYPFKNRTQHLYSEQKRTLKAIEALKLGNIKEFGSFISQSHASLRDDFEISIPEMDSLVDSALGFGALGARLTGGGFGGCIVACVERHNFDEWLSRLLEDNPKATLIC